MNKEYKYNLLYFNMKYFGSCSELQNLLEFLDNAIFDGFINSDCCELN